MRIDGKVCLGVEALIRWKKAQAVVSPMEFIPLAENTFVSGPIKYWLIDTVAKEVGAWMQGQDEAFISLNIPPELFGRGGLWYAALKNALLDIAKKFVTDRTGLDIGCSLHWDSGPTPSALGPLRITRGRIDRAPHARRSESAPH